MAIQVVEALDHCDYLHDPDHSEVLSLLEQLYGQQRRLSEANGATARPDAALKHNLVYHSGRGLDINRGEKCTVLRNRSSPT